MGDQQSKNHFVSNGGNEDRVHMILDYVLPGEKIIDRDGETLTCPGFG